MCSQTEGDGIPHYKTVAELEESYQSECHMRTQVWRSLLGHPDGEMGHLRLSGKMSPQAPLPRRDWPECLKVVTQGPGTEWIGNPLMLGWISDNGDGECSQTFALTQSAAAMCKRSPSISSSRLGIPLTVDQKGRLQSQLHLELQEYLGANTCQDGNAIGHSHLLPVGCSSKSITQRRCLPMCGMLNRGLLFVMERNREPSSVCFISKVPHSGRSSPNLQFGVGTPGSAPAACRLVCSFTSIAGCESPHESPTSGMYDRTPR